MSITKIAHLADIHIRKSIARHPEYRLVFNELYTDLFSQQPDRIVVAGDLFHDYIKLEGEVVVLAAEFLNNLAKIAKVIIVRGNHDVSRSAPKRTDAIQALVSAMDNANVVYYNETGLYDDDNVVWAIWKHGEKRNNPWPKNFEKVAGKTYIDIFHDPINGARNSDGFEFKSKTYRSPKEFLGDIGMFGDIHLFQTLNNDTKAYSSSLIEQTFGEGDEQFHGYLLWDLPSLEYDQRPIYNPFGHFTVDVNQYTNFDKLMLSVESKVPNKRLRVKWKTLPGVKTIENMRKVDLYLTAKYEPLSIKHMNDFIVENKVTIEEQADIENITKREIIHKVITEYLEKIGIKADIINDILELDTEIENRLVLEDLTNIQWSILKVWGKNFRSYDEISIDWQNRDGVYQIVGENGTGKSTINQLITYILFGRSLETDFKKKFGDARFVNNKNNAIGCEGGIILVANGEYYAIKRVTTVKRNKEGEITSSPTVATYYKLNSPDDEISEEFNITVLTEEGRNATQARIDEIIGSYENFIRVTLTTADTLNSVLSSDKSTFIDSLLFDAGLNIFDLRLKEFKKYLDELIADPRLTNFNVVDQLNQVQSLKTNISSDNEQINSIQLQLSVAQGELSRLKDEKDVLSQSIHQIDGELGNTNENQISTIITALNTDKLEIKKEEGKLHSQIAALKSSYDAAKLEELLKRKDAQKSMEFEKRTAITKHKMQIEQVNSDIYRLNGEVELMKKEGTSLKKRAIELETSKTCPTCGQLKLEDAVERIKASIKEIEAEMYQLAANIKTKLAEKPNLEFLIQGHQSSILEIEAAIKAEDLKFQQVLEEIGQITNDKIEVEKCERLKLETGKFPMRYENIDLRIREQQQKLVRFNDQKVKIEENNKVKVHISNLNSKIEHVTLQIESNKHQILTLTGRIESTEATVIQKEELIKAFYAHERRQHIHKVYASCIHRDGIPTQILTDTLLPNINNILSKLLETADFDVFLDKEDLRLKFFHNAHPSAVIDCISASGMERTFAVYCLKIALNQCNTKSKSTFFAVDEIMGKLKGEYVEKFVELLHLSKKFYKKVIIIEPTHEVNPDYLLQVEMNEKLVSKLIQE